METGDGYYQPPLVVQPLDRHGHYMASQAGASVEWLLRQDLLIEAWAARFFVAGEMQAVLENWGVRRKLTSEE